MTLSEKILRTTISEVARALPTRLTQQSCRWFELPESLVWHELVSAILGSAVSFESALRATEALCASGLMSPGLGLAVSDLESCLRSSGYRFPASRARQIVETSIAVYGSGRTMKELLGSRAFSSSEAREFLVNLCSGIGPKQASLFLRNIGFAEPAILDRHVLAFLGQVGLIAVTVDGIQSLKQYCRVEELAIEYASSLKLTVAEFDLAVWVTMRELSSMVKNQDVIGRSSIGRC